MNSYSKTTNDPILAGLLGEAVATVKASEGSILLFTESGSHLRFVVSNSPVAERLLGSEIPLNEGITGLAVCLQQPMIVNETQSNPDFSKTIDSQSGVTTKSILVIPLVTPEQEFGAFTAINSRDQDGFGREDLEIYSRYAEQVCHRLVELDLGMDHVGAI